VKPWKGRTNKKRKSGLNLRTGKRRGGFALFSVKKAVFEKKEKRESKTNENGRIQERPDVLVVE